MEIPCYCNLITALFTEATEGDQKIWDDKFIPFEHWDSDLLVNYDEMSRRYFKIQETPGRDITCNELAKAQAMKWVIDIGCLSSQKDVDAACLIFDLLSDMRPFSVNKVNYYGIMPGFPVTRKSGKFETLKMIVQVKAQRRLRNVVRSA